MIEMSVSDQDRVRLRREMSHFLSNASDIWLNARIQRDAQKIHAREIRINKQCVAPELELVTVCAEISHAHSVARRSGGVINNQVSIGTQPRAKSLRGEPEEKKKRAFQALMTDFIERCIVANCKFA
jgi:hypothetical protein